MKQSYTILGVCFDVGEIIVNETREYGTWADWLGVPRHDFSARFGATIAQGDDYRKTFTYFDPNFDLTRARQARADAGKPETFSEEDIYPDVRACLKALKDLGLKVSLAGNQTARAGGILRSLFSNDVDFIRTSDDWGVSKPDTAFFDRVVQEMDLAPSQILYVGDRLDNDIRPAQEVGLQTCLVQRGPWGRILQMPQIEKGCTFIITDLTTLSDLVAKHNQ
ncbi:MAG TPA: HAD family hydrolase [Verrucomicrobiae bacterium]|nr:HAD family hydrolase [Verrucomicrobiae bacterium]